MIIIRFDKNGSCSNFWFVAATTAIFPRRIRPQLTELVDAAPDGDQWLHEIKYDGYRMHARLDRGAVRLLTRTGLDWTHKYPAIAAAVSSLGAGQAISTASCAAWAPTASPPSA
jgi:bifunctional non-homologous end joining protein LigD